MLEQIYSVIEQRFSTGFEVSKDVDPATTTLDRDLIPILLISHFT